MGDAIDDVTLDLTVQDPDKSFNGNPEQMEKVIAQSPTDLTQIEDVIVDLTNAKDKTEQGFSLAQEAIAIKKRGRISASEAMALDDVAPGIVGPENPIGLYTDRPTPVNTDNTVQRVNNQATAIIADGFKDAKLLNEQLVKLLNATGSNALTAIDQAQQECLNAVALYTQAHGFTPIDVQRIGDPECYERTHSRLEDHVARSLSRKEQCDAIDDYMNKLIGFTLTVRTSDTLIDALLGNEVLMVNDQGYDLRDVGAGNGLGLTSITLASGSNTALDKRFSVIVESAGSEKVINHMRLLAGAMLGLAKYLGESLQTTEAPAQDLNVARTYAFTSLQAAALGQQLQRRLTQLLGYVQATSELYRNVASAVDTVSSASVATEGIMGRNKRSLIKQLLG